MTNAHDHFNSGEYLTFPPQDGKEWMQKTSTYQVVQVTYNEVTMERITDGVEITNSPSFLLDRIDDGECIRGKVE